MSATAAAQLHLAASRCGLSCLQIIQTSGTAAPLGSLSLLPTSAALCQVLHGHLSSLMMQPPLIHDVPVVLAEEEAPAEVFLSGFGCLNPFSCASLLTRVGPSFSLAQQLEEVVQAVYGAAGEGAEGQLLPSVPQSLTLLAAQLVRRRLPPPPPPPAAVAADAAHVSGLGPQVAQGSERAGAPQAAESTGKEEQMGPSRNQQGSVLQGKQQQQQQQGERGSRWRNSASAAVSRAAENLRVRQQQQQPWTPQDHQEEPLQEAGHADQLQPFSRGRPPTRDAEPAVDSAHQPRRDRRDEAANNAFSRLAYRRPHQQQPGDYGRGINMAEETAERSRRWLQHGSAAPPGGRSGGKTRHHHQGAGVQSAVACLGPLSSRGGASVSPCPGHGQRRGDQQRKQVTGPVRHTPVGSARRPEEAAFRSPATTAPPGVASSSLSAAGSSASASRPRPHGRVFSSDAKREAARREPPGRLMPPPRSLLCQSGQLGPSAMGRRSSSSATYSLLMPLVPEEDDEETDACLERLLDELPDGGGQGGGGRSYWDDGNFTDGRGGFPFSAAADGGFGRAGQHAEEGAEELLLGRGTSRWTGTQKQPSAGWGGHLQQLLQQDALEDEAVDFGWGAAEEDPRALSSNNSASAFGGHGAFSGDRAALEEGWLEASGPRCPPPPPPPHAAWSDGGPPLPSDILRHRPGLGRGRNGGSGEATRTGEQQQLQADSEADARRRWGGRRVNQSAQRAIAIGRQLVGKGSGGFPGATC